MSRAERRNLRNGLLFASPWLIGLAVFMAYPILSSVYYSFCDYSTLQDPVWVGLQNYRDLVDDSLFYKSLRNTMIFGLLSLPASMITMLALAILLNSGVRGLTLFRTIFYLPCLVPAVASAMLWLWVFNGDYGILNYALNGLLAPVSDGATSILQSFLGNWFDLQFDESVPIVAELRNLVVGTLDVNWQAPTWLGDPLWAKPAYAIMTVWSAGGMMVIYLAGLQDVPNELYEAAEIDGAGWWRRLFHVTLPSLSSVLYFTLIIGLINALQIFTPAYIMGGGPQGGTAGQPSQSTLFYAIYLWARAFEDLDMGYGCAMAWILFLIIVVLTLIAHKTTKRHVTYAG